LPIPSFSDPYRLPLSSSVLELKQLKCWFSVNDLNAKVLS
jgi:hypothetical protein